MTEMQLTVSVRIFVVLGFLGVLTSVGSETVSASDASCPIVVTAIDHFCGVIPNDPDYRLQKFGIECFVGKWKNESDKTVTGIRFKAWGVNSLNEVSEVRGLNPETPPAQQPDYVDFISSRQVKPGKGKFDRFYTKASDSNTTVTRFAPIKVAFSDGSIWEDDGNKCAFETRKK